MSFQLNTVSLMLIMTIRLLPDAAGRPAGRYETGNPLRQNALDPGFHSVPVDPAYTNRDADGAGVS
jgi:hypothetical protein